MKQTRQDVVTVTVPAGFTGTVTATWNEVKTVRGNRKDLLSRYLDLNELLASHQMNSNHAAWQAEADALWSYLSTH